LNELLSRNTIVELAYIVDDPIAHRTPSTSQLSVWDEDRKKDVVLQMKQVKIKAGQEEKGREHTMGEEAIRKRREREEKRVAKEKEAQEKALLDSGNCIGVAQSGDGPGLLFANIEHQSTKEAADARLDITKSSYTPAYSVTVPASSSDLPWYSPSAHVDLSGAPSSSTQSSSYDTLSAAAKAGIWSYPSTPIERTRCAVFRDLWEKGYYMGGGIKFGGDWLVYPGDPLRYHSHFVATAHMPDTLLKPMEIVAHGRLGTATKKAHLLCTHVNEEDTVGEGQYTVDKKDSMVKYLSIEWAGFG
jgi:tRNA-splicing endonuclease subunit Sen34